MKVWRFYIKPNEEPDIVRKSYDLYALTSMKDYAYNFMNTRNMDRFYTRCTKEDKETYIQLANDNRSCVLSEYKTLTRAVNNNGLISHKEVTVVMTEAEYQSINGEEYLCQMTSDPDWWDTGFNYKLCKKKIKSALRTLDYIQNYKFFKLYFQVSPMAALDSEDDDYSAPGWYVDELGAFISTYNKTFK